MDAGILTRENFSDYNGAAPGNYWDFQRFNPAYFRHYDHMIQQLMELGIEADLILFHAYDRWGFSAMTMEENLLYLRYVAARYSAFRNVWWSLANEYELMRHLTADDWEQMGMALKESDPYHHLLSIHNCEIFLTTHADGSPIAAASVRITTRLQNTPTICGIVLASPSSGTKSDMKAIFRTVGEILPRRN